MKTIILIIFMLLSDFTGAQQFEKEKSEIRKVVQQFRQSIRNKDSAAFYSLFHKDPVVWTGVVKNRSQKKRMEAHPENRKNYFSDTYRNFFGYILEKGDKEELFENIKIINDDVIASVTFDYSFREENTQNNWGCEYWHLIKAEGKWKIVSVIYSYENSRFFPKP